MGETAGGEIKMTEDSILHKKWLKPEKSLEK